MSISNWIDRLLAYKKPKTRAKLVNNNNPKRLFPEGYHKTFPCDVNGHYRTLSGKIVSINNGFKREDGTFDLVKVEVMTEYGCLYGFITTPPKPKVGYDAKIRVYNCGGGWYPDDLIEWWSNEDGSEQMTYEITEQ
jgi:hypothetical protein